MGPLKLFKEALLGKWLWRLGDGQDGLWKKIVMVKYNVTRDGWDTQRTKPSRSRFWRDLLSVRASFVSMVHYRVGTGDGILFWPDTWVGEAPLASQSPNLFHCARDISVMVRDYFSKKG